MPIPEVLATIGWGLVTNFLSNLVDPPLLGHLTAGKRLENHDLQRALHLAFVRAQEQICNQCLDHPELSADDRKLLRQRQAALAAERKQLSRIDKIDPPVQAVAEYTLLVTPTTADLQQKQADLSARLLAVAAPAEARDLPGIYRDRLQEQLFDWTGRFFMAQIKYDDTVFRALMAETTGLNLQLQVINQAKLEAMLHRLLAEIGGIGPRGALSGNLPRATTHFVGRGAELQALADALLAGRPGAIAVLHGFGGMGKSELAAEFARRNADQLKAGAWRLSAEGRLELLPLIGDLTYDLGLVPSAGPAETAEMRGRRVLAELKRRAEAAGTPEQGGAALLLLDNLDKAQLLAEPQINSLPGEGWLKIVATTRLGKAVLRARSLEFVLVDRLPEEAAVQLMRDHQTEKNWPAATAELDDAAAHELARELDGFTLAVETVAIYLGKYSEIRPADLLARLRSEGLSSTDALAADVSEQIAHREKQLALVLDATLERLEPLARTALDFAALLPPDSVPWPWLRALVEREHPEGLQRRVGHPDPWAGVQRQLEDFRLLSPTDQKEVARLHRLVGAHLVKRLEEGERKLQLVREQLLAVAEELAETGKHSAEPLWQLVPLQAAAAGWDPGARGLEYSYVADVVGEMEMRLGRLDVAEPFLLGAMEVDEANYMAHLQSDTAAANLAISLYRLADLCSLRGMPGDVQRAIAFSERSLQLREDGQKAGPKSAKALRQVSLSLRQVAHLLTQRSQSGDSERVLEYYRRSLRLCEQLRKADPESVQAIRDLAISLDKLAAFLQATQPGATERALAYLERGLRLCEELLEKNPKSAQAMRDVAVALEKLADLLRNRGQPGDMKRALASYQRGLEIYEHLYSANPQSAQAMRDVAVSLEKLATLVRDRGEPGDAERALAYYKRGLELCEQLYKANPQSALVARTKLVALERMADATGEQAATGAARTALSLQQQALDLARQLWDTNPTSAYYGRTAVVSLRRTDRLAEAAGESNLAARCRSDCHALLKHLITSGFELDKAMHDMYATLTRELGAPD